MSEGVGYDIVDFIKGVEANKLTGDDFINFNTLPRNKLKAFREEIIPACSTEELTKFTTNLFSAHIDRAFSEELNAFEAPVLIREQSQLYLLVNTCMKEIGKRYLELQDSPEKFGTVKIDPAILACYSNYSDRLTESILKMPEENIRHMLSEDIAKIIENQNLKAGNEVASNAMENLLEKLFTRDDVLKSNIRYALVGLPNSNEKDLIEQVNEVLANYDVDNNRKEIADYIANRNIAYSISFVMYKNMLEMPSEVMSHEAGDILAKHIELAKPYGQYVMALRTQDLTSQIPLKEAILSHVQGNDSIQENSELLKMAQQIDTSKSKDNQQENVSVLKYVETVDEIEAFMPMVGEEALLDEKRKVLISKTKILEATLESTSILDMPGTGVISQLCAIEKALSRFPDYFSDVNLKFEAIRIDLQELSNTVEHKRSELIINEDLDFIENRLFELRNLIRKYRVTDNDLNKFLEYAKKQYEMICDIGSIIERLSKELQDAQGNYLREAKLLSERRKTAAFELRSKILAEFQHINLEKADILVQVDELDIQEAKKNGINNVTFLIKTNSNSEFGALSKIASGGELSRFMLAYKVALSGNKGVTSIIFDEIDSGIGGKFASNVGKKLLKLSDEKQVIVVTHQPQVVVYANNHYLVEKEQTNEAAKVTVNKLSKLDSVSEVARMLSGSSITEEAIAAAQKLFISA